MTEVLSAAADCFMEMGFAATSIDDVARRMGATKGRVYHYYRSKTDLFFDVYRYSLERIQSPVAEIAAEDRPPRERFRDMVRAHALSIMDDLRFHRVASQGVEMLARGATTPDQRKALADLIATRAGYEALFRDVMTAGRAAGAMSFGDANITTKTLLAGLNGLVYWYRSDADGGRKSGDEIADEMVRFALKCVAPESKIETEETP
jgi:AcrR family transcriptional regulator